MPVRDVRVQDRGSFFDDAFFKDSWEDFDTAMQRVLDRFDGHGVRVNQTSRPECQDIYRKIRSNKIDDDMYASQAIQVTEKDGRFQVVVDVRDFNPTDLQVKVIDEKVVLEGRYDKVSEDGKSSSSKAFYREFMLPVEADIEQISTALSRDGILTIRAPRKEGTFPQPPHNTANTAAASQFLQNTLNEHRYGNGANYPTNNKSYIQNAPSYESTEGFDSLPKDVRERLLISDRDSGRGSTLGSPCQSGFSSPAPSEAGSESSRVSSRMDYDTGKRSPFQKPEPPFKVVGPRGSKVGQGPPGPPGSPGSSMYQQQPQMNVSNVQQPRSSAAVGSGGTASITVKEEDGKKTLTSEKSSLVQQKDGFLESKEIAAEVTENNSQAARREAITRMMKTDEDPEGRYKKSEAADASDVSESCVQQLPDGSVMKVKKSSTSTSNVKISSTSGLPPSQGFPPAQGFLEPNFSSGFGEMPNLMGRGHNLMSQMSTDSVASNMSNFSDMSNFSRFSDRSSFSDMQSGFPNRGGNFQDRMPGFSGFPNFPPMGQMSQMNPNQPMPQTSNFSKTFSSTSQTSQTSHSSGFDNMKF